MGLFSYDCSLCGGGDEQFGWQRDCVVKIMDGVYVKGRYNGFGQVEVFVVHDLALFQKYLEKCAAEGSHPIFLYNAEKDKASSEDLLAKAGATVESIQLKQFEKYWRAWHGGFDGAKFTVVQGNLFGTYIFCCGDKDKVAKQAAEREKCSVDDDEYRYFERFCVPGKIKWKDYLLKSEMDGLPKVGFYDFPNEQEGMKWKMIEESKEWKRQMRGETYLNVQELRSRMGLDRLMDKLNLKREE